jgi:hypothetical protein
LLPNRAIICASGNSISDGIKLGLSNYLEREIVFGINDNIKFIWPTVAMFGDWTAYASRFDLYKEHPLVIGRYDTHFTHKIEGAIPCPKQDDLILLPGSGKYNGVEGLSKGLYSAVLTGAFTLNLAIRLGFHQIFLLGFDNCVINGKTHFYQDVPSAGKYTDYEGNPTTGVGKDEQGNYRTSFYNHSDDSINDLWKPFEVEEAMIYNVSLDSRIELFQKISYQSMITVLNQNRTKINQEKVQKEIRNLLEPYNKLEK